MYKSLSIFLFTQAPLPPRKQNPTPFWVKKKKNEFDLSAYFSNANCSRNGWSFYIELKSESEFPFENQGYVCFFFNFFPKNKNHKLSLISTNKKFFFKCLWT